MFKQKFIFIVMYLLLIALSTDNIEAFNIIAILLKEINVNVSVTCNFYCMVTNTFKICYLFKKLIQYSVAKNSYEILNKGNLFFAIIALL